MGAQAVRLSNVDIDNALKNKDFEVLFQPIFDLGNGALARVETFVRWRHPMLGVLPPGAFISFFESQGRMSELTRYVLDEALTNYRDWRGASAPGFSINLALSDLSDEAFASHFTVLLRDRGFPADLITLECPMPPVTMEIDAAAEHFSRLSETGARLAIEVRGRANDFLKTIEPFPFDEIKTGGAAILRFARTVRGPGLSAISELLDIANQSNAAITAVGVEDQASLAALRGLGFAAAQGNHLGKVGPLAAFTPSRVNEVRALLGLEALSSQDLQALFRTEAPAPKSASGDQTAKSKPASKKPPEQDELVERLAARLERQEAAAETTVAEAPAEPAPAKTASTKTANAKAAAIARAKRKAASISKVKEAAKRAAVAKSASATDAGEAAAARSLQERLSREFASGGNADADESDDAFKFAAEETAKSGAQDAAPEASEPETAATAADEAPQPDEPATHAIEEETKATEQEPAVRDAAEKPAEPSKEAASPEEEAAEAAVAEAPAQAFAGATLAVGKTGAHFRPGLRIGVVEPRIPGVKPGGVKPATPEPAPAAATPEVAEPAAQEGAPAVETASAAEAPTVDAQTEEPARAAFGLATPAEPDADHSDVDKGDLAKEVEADWERNAEVAEESPQRRRKSFLKRKYRIWPTHFWPVSWKRAWRRRQAEADRRADQRAEMETAE